MNAFRVALLSGLCLMALLVFAGETPAARRKARPAMEAYRKTHLFCEVPGCGRKGNPLRPLEVAHIKPVKPFPELAADTNNVIMMCFGCHRYLQHVGGNTKKYTVNLREWLNARKIEKSP